ncbi:MAG: hypothetical protein PHQ43_15065, partial [Dehalococcoidales bacterium]|nr:hypothetical protein [Dehalococcoidales bacterium]
WTPPSGLPKESKVIADYEIEVPGDLVQRATVARMLDPNFKLSYQYVMRKLFPEIKDYLREVARTQADDVQRGPVSAAIAAVGFYRSQAEFLRKAGDNTNARLYELAADAAMAQIQPPEKMPQVPSRPAIGDRTEAVPQIPPPGGI